MNNLFTVEHLLGVGSFECSMQEPARGFYALGSLDSSFRLVLVDTSAWFSNYDYSEIIADVEKWSQGHHYSVATTVNSQDGSLAKAVTNLAGPLIIDWEGKRIRQFVLYSGKYPLQTALVGKGGTD